MIFARNVTIPALKRLSEQNIAHALRGMLLDASSFHLKKHWFAQWFCTWLKWIETLRNIYNPCHIWWILQPWICIVQDCNKNFTISALKWWSKWNPAAGQRQGISECHHFTYKTIGLRKVPAYLPHGWGRAKTYIILVKFHGFWVQLSALVRILHETL